MELSLPKGIELREDSSNLFLFCYACALRVGVFNDHAHQSDIEKTAVEHTMSKNHLAVVRAVNAPKGLVK